MKSLRLPIASLILILNFVCLNYSQNEAEVLGSFISKQAIKNHAEEYKDAREVLQGDIDGDGENDLVALYALNGFKAHIGCKKYLAIFLGRGGKFRYADSQIVSGIVERLIELKSIERGTINLETLEYLESGENHYRIQGTMRFILIGGKLKRARLSFDHWNQPSVKDFVR